MDNPFFDDPEELKWTLVMAGTTILAGVAVRTAMKVAWRGLRDEDPPLNPADPRVGWAEAAVWAGASAAGVAVARLLARRGAAAGWHRFKGTMPPL